MKLSVLLQAGTLKWAETPGQQQKLVYPMLAAKKLVFSIPRLQVAI